VQEAYAAVADTAVSACLVNCCGANFVERAVRSLRDLTDRPIGGYANAADVLPGNEHEPVLPPEQVKRELLDVDGYAEAVMAWIAAGATLVGGCCSTRPQPIARIRERLDNIS
jgi:S-methylmethionine-dependent homocysteine/selenocysteine methylase